MQFPEKRAVVCLQDLCTALTFYKPLTGVCAFQSFNPNEKGALCALGNFL